MTADFMTEKSKEEKELISNMFKDKRYIIRMIIPGEIHATIY